MSDTIRVLKIPVDGDIETIQIKAGDYKAFQEQVGGVFQIVTVELYEYTMMMHEEAKIIGLPVNERATLLL